MLKTLMIGASLLGAPLLAQSATQTTPATQPGGKDDPGTPRTPLPADRGYDKPQARTEAINAPNRDNVAAANSMTTGSGAASIQNDAAQAMYDSDMAAWLYALRARETQIAADTSSYMTQQRAYADAMAAWRRQVYACNSGQTAACRLPTPNPADYR